MVSDVLTNSIYNNFLLLFFMIIIVCDRDAFIIYKSQIVHNKL